MQPTMITAMEPSRVEEREMSANQRGLIDTCFEEGHYETGIYVFDSLRNAETKPSIAHIRQLLYLALYPPPEKETGNNAAATDANLPTSPSKLGAKQQRSVLIPTEAASHAALRLLEAFVSTNSPDALLRALPRFRQNGVDSSVSQAGLMTTHEDEDSFLARSSRIIRDAKHCWELFREGFVKPYTDATASRTNGRKRKTTTKDTQYSDEEGGGDFEQPLAVAPYAWPVLQWLLSVIEKEEIWIERGGELRHSRFLLSQILPPRAATSKPWDAAAALEVIIFCLENEDPHRKRLGIRLLQALINLTATDLIDTKAFLAATFNKLQTISSPTLIFLLSMFPQTTLAVQFKLALCKHLLQGMSGTLAKSRSQPQNRARPIRPTQKSSQINGDSSQSTSRSGSTTPGNVPRYPTVTSHDVLGLLETSGTASARTSVDTLRVQYELVLAFVFMQSQADDRNRDVEWSQILSNGKITAAIERLFVHSGSGQTEEAKDVDMMKQVLLSVTQGASS